MTDAGYSKGYAAGRRRLEADDKRHRAELSSYYETQAAELRQFRRDVFCAALNGLIFSGSWQTDGKPIRSIEGYMAAAERFSMRASEKAYRR